MVARQHKNRPGGWLLFIFFCFCAIFGYQHLSALWVPIGNGAKGLSSSHFLLEIPLTLLLLLFLYFPEISRRTVRFITPVAVLMIVYSLYDLFYYYLLRTPRPSDFSNIPLLPEFSPAWGTALLLYASLVPILILMLIIMAAAGSDKVSFGYRLLLRISLLAIVCATLTTGLFNRYHAQVFQELEWSQEETIRNNGRLASFLFFGNREWKNTRILKSYREQNLDIHETLFPGKPVRLRNVHIVVFESFVDPRLIEGTLFRPDPVSENLKPYLLETEWEFSHLYSPEYGGGTAQIEFELLTGIKAYEGVGTVSFNVMEGEKMQSFPERLKQYGYSTLATVATGPGYFNAQRAYRSLGIAPVRFLGDQDADIRQEGDAFLFDGDLLEYNLKQLREFRAESEGPVLNYVLGMYGHTPYERNFAKRPDRIDVIHSDDRVKRISNQFSYRTEALGIYLDKLIADDPHSIIFVCSDHVPPILGSDVRYIFGKYRNIALFLIDGKPVDMSGREYFEIPWVIWDILRGVEYDERSVDETLLKELYFKALSQTLKTGR